MSEKRTLHILKNKTDRVPIDLIKHIEKFQKIAIVLIQDAVEMNISPLKTPALVLLEDLPSFAETSHQKITYDQLLDLIFEYDAVVSW